MRERLKETGICETQDRRRLLQALRSFQSKSSTASHGGASTSSWRADATSPSLLRAIAVSLEIVKFRKGQNRVACADLLMGVLLAFVKDGIRNAGCTALSI